MTGDLSNFPMPSIGEFRAMDADAFERFWRMFQQTFPPPHESIGSIADIERAITLKRAGWTPQPSSSRLNDSLWNWVWYSPPVDPTIYALKTQEAHRQHMIATTGVDPMADERPADPVNRRNFLRSLAVSTAALYLRIAPDAAANVPRSIGLNPDWENAEYEVQFIGHESSFKRLCPADTFPLRFTQRDGILYPVDPYL